MTDIETVPVPVQAPVNIDEKLKGLFSSSSSADGSEEILKAAANFALQLPAIQIQALLRIEDIALEFRSDEQFSLRLTNFVKRWIELKRYNNSAMFVQRALDSISLKKFIQSGQFDVGIQKK